MVMKENTLRLELVQIFNQKLHQLFNFDITHSVPIVEILLEYLHVLWGNQLDVSGFNFRFS